MGFSIHKDVAALEPSDADGPPGGDALREASPTPKEMGWVTVDWYGTLVHWMPDIGQTGTGLSVLGNPHARGGPGGTARPVDVARRGADLRVRSGAGAAALIRRPDGQRRGRSR